MSNIDLKQFVDINIQAHVTSAVSGIRDTIALFTPEGTQSTIKDFTSLDDVTYAENTATYAYLKQYFDNGGVKAKVYEGIGYNALTKDIITALDDSIICVSCVAPTENKEDCYKALKTIGVAMNADKSIYGINEKLIITSTNVNISDLTQPDYSASVKNFIVKYSSVLGSEMTIAAYLSQINIDVTDSVKDYAFTQEILTTYNAGQWKYLNGENISNDEYTALQNVNMNVDVYLANAVRNCGGNCKDGADIVNNFVRIVLHQTLTDQLLNLLTQKIKSNTGVSKLYTVIAQELERYLNCGYLTTDKIWTDNTLKVTRNNVAYTIINKGDALTNGYEIKILPMSSLTDSERAAHKAPPIYVIIADQYSIRKITINGEVI